MLMIMIMTIKSDDDDDDDDDDDGDFTCGCLSSRIAPGFFEATESLRNTEVSPLDYE